jgi:hypothetical protein
MQMQMKFAGCILGGLLLMFCTNSASAQYEEFFIVSEGDTILVGEDIESYNRTSHRLALTTGGYAKWKGYENQPPPEGRTLVERTILTDRGFVVIYAGEVVAEGYICSGTESSLKSGLNLWDNQTQSRQSTLGFIYCRFEPDMPPDPLEFEAFWAYFEKFGKLID